MIKSATNDKVYKSTVRKLARWFEKSRDNWKAKYCEAKKTIKYLKNRVRFLEENRDHWKMRVQELEVVAKQMEAKESELKEKLEAFKQRGSKKEDSGAPDDFALIPRNHQYSVGHVKQFMDLVLSDAASLRGASRAAKRVISSLQIPLDIPQWHTGRLWLLRLGYYELTRQKEKANDWVWIVDHTVQIGIVKCFVILGLRLKNLPPAGQSLGHKDVELIDLLPVEKSNKDIVYEQLEANIEKTGPPRLIVGDHGPDLKAGVEKFCLNHQQTDFIYDIKHKTAAVLKREFAKDERWLEFVKEAALTKHRLQRGSLAHLIPPNQRAKARYMNIDVLVRWGQDILAFFDEDQSKNSSEYDQEDLQEKFGWVTSFRQSIHRWGEIVQVTNMTESFVRTQGLYSDADLRLKEVLENLVHCSHAQEVCEDLTAFVGQEASKARDGEQLLGSSEVIESILGKLKYLEKDQAKSGFTVLLLSIGAVVASTASDVILTALESVPTQKIRNWRQEMLGDSVQAKRKKALNAHRKSEQNWNHFFHPV